MEENKPIGLLTLKKRLNNLERKLQLEEQDEHKKESFNSVFNNFMLMKKNDFDSVINMVYANMPKIQQGLYKVIRHVVDFIEDKTPHIIRLFGNLTDKSSFKLNTALDIIKNYLGEMFDELGSQTIISIIDGIVDDDKNRVRTVTRTISETKKKPSSFSSMLGKR